MNTKAQIWIEYTNGEMRIRNFTSKFLAKRSYNYYMKKAKKDNWQVIECVTMAF